MVIYRLCCSSGNAVGVDEYISYSEIGADGRWSRYVEIKADGTARLYSASHPADEFGVLPEGRWDEAEAAKPRYGIVAEISGQLLEAVWHATRPTHGLTRP